ncbi:MAG: GtrA family protein [Patescibacteria group bacterium]
MQNYLSFLENSFLWRSRFLRVATIGIAGLLVQTLVFEILGFWLELVRPSTAVVMGAEFGIVTNFLLNNRFAFNNHSHAPFVVRFLRFHLVVLGSLFIQWLCVFIVEQLTTSTLALHGAYALGVIIGFISNYTGYRLWVWQQSGSVEKESPPTYGR